MLYDEITNLVKFGNNLLHENPVFFHGLVAAGTIMTAALGIMNSSHLKKQANLQREIEGNRYKLDLFDKRFKIWTEFQSMVSTPTGPIYEATHAELISISQTVKENMKYTKKPYFCFLLMRNLMSYMTSMSHQLILIKY